MPRRAMTSSSPPWGTVNDRRKLVGEDWKEERQVANRLEVIYQAATFSERMLGHGEPLYVGRGVLFRLRKHYENL